MVVNAPQMYILSTIRMTKVPCVLRCDIKYDTGKLCHRYLDLTAYRRLREHTLTVQYW
jgi:hypothetical protein